MVGDQRGRNHGGPPPEAGLDGLEPAWDSGWNGLGMTGVATLGPSYGGYAGVLLFATWHSGALPRARLSIRLDWLPPPPWPRLGLLLRPRRRLLLRLVL